MEENKKSLKMPIIILIVILALILIGGAVYVSANQQPKKIFTDSINSYIDELGGETEEVKTLNATLSLGININNAQNEEVTKVAEYLNKAKLTANVQMDYEQEKELVKLGLDYDNEKVLDAKLSYKNQEDNAYGYVEELFDKYFAIPFDEDTRAELASIFEECKNLSAGDNSSDKAIDFIESSISDRLKDEYFSQEEARIDVDGKEINTKKSTLTLTVVQLKEVLSGLVEDLKKDEFINCFADEDKEEVKESINEIETSLNELKESLGDDENAIMKFNIYSKGINSEIVKFEIIAIDESEEYNISILKNDKETYKLLVTEKTGEQTEEVLNSIITVKDVDDKTTNITVALNIQDVGDITVDLQASYVTNEPIEDLDTTNSVSIDGLSEEDQEKIMSNLQNMKIYQIIQEIYMSMYNY